MTESPEVLLSQDEVPAQLPVSGGLVAIIGNSGSGKSTLFRLLQSALLSRRTLDQLADARAPGPGPRWFVSEALVTRGGQTLAVTPQENGNVLPSLTALENVLHYLGALPWCRAHRPGVLAAATDGDLADPVVRAQAALRVVDLSDKAETRAGGLSGGEQRRLLLAMDLALGPRVLVADEPLSQLDSSSASKVFHALLDQAKEGPVLFTVHQPIDEWLERCDQVWVVERGCRVVAAMPGKDFVRAADRLSLGGEEDATLLDLPRVRDASLRPEQMSLVDMVETARSLLGTDGDGGQPAAYRVLFRLKSPEHRDATLAALRAATATALIRHAAAPERPAEQEGSGLARVVHTLLHGVREDFVGNLRSSLYWVMLSMFIGVTFFTNFFGDADELPFAIPLATNALLVSILFVSTVSGVRVWTGPAGDRVRQLVVRRLGLGPILAGKLAPALLEALLIAALALVGTWTLELRGSAPGWPDAFAPLPWASGLSAVVLLMVFVGVVGWTQGATISLLMAVAAQRSALRHFSAPRSSATGKRGGEPGAAPDPVQRAYSLAVLLVVGQIGLGGAFGQITSDYDDLARDAPSLVVDGLGSLSPLRWAYNAALIAEWRQARCRVRGDADERCGSSLPRPRVAQQCVVGGLPPGQDTFMPGEATWADIGSQDCGRTDAGDRDGGNREDGALEPDRRRTVALYFQASGDDADRLDRLLVRRRLLDEREVLLPAQATSQAFAAQSYARLNEVRRREAPGEDLPCYQREANLDYLYGLTETMVAKGMIRPSLLDVEWCWRSCPDVRPASGAWRDGRLEPLARDTFMLGACPDPGETGSGDVMKAFFRPAVSLLDGSGAYPCRDLAHDLFVDRARFSSQVQALCAGRALTDAEENLLFWMTAVAAGWASLALSLAFAWSGRVARGA